MGYTMNLSMIEYKTCIIREDFEAAAGLLPSIPKVSCLCNIGHAAPPPTPSRGPACAAAPVRGRMCSA